MLEYRIKDGVLRFEDGVEKFDALVINSSVVYSIDFNQVKHFNMLDLRKTSVDNIYLENVITFEHLLTKNDVYVYDNTYWYKSIVGGGYITSKRMYYIRKHKSLVYLSGKVVGRLELRFEQRKLLMSIGRVGVYSPGNHMTLGDPIADNYPSLVYDIDIKAMEEAKYLVFDLRELSPGTSAELGYTVAKGWDKTKLCYYIYNDTPNFFINGLLKNMKRFATMLDIANQIKEDENV